jgi:putative N6-adenine-specific DNA methylase
MPSASDFPSREIMAVVAPGLEAVVAAELAQLGWPAPRTIPGGVLCTGGRIHLWHACLGSRTATDLRLRVGRLQAHSLEGLAQGLQRLPWSLFLRPGQDPRVLVSSHGSPLKRRDAIARKSQIAIRDALRGPRLPDLAPHRGSRVPGPVVHLHLEGEQVEASLDPAGAPLWQRGYRARGGAAPLRENLAAAVLRALEWGSPEALVDPFAGSGTFLIEGAAMARGLPPGLGRHFAFELWPCHDARAWGRTVEDARRRAPPGPTGPILGADADDHALDLARANAAGAGVGTAIRWQAGRVDALQPPPGAPGLVVANPPWGRRLGQDVGGVYVAFGQVLRARFTGWRIGVLCPDPALIRLMHLPLQRLLAFPHGGTRVTLWAGTVA